MAKLNPYLMFSAQARPAMEFYREVFGGELTVNTFGDFGMAGGDTGAPEDGVMHAQLETDLGFTLMAADVPPAWPARSSNGHVSVSGDETEALTGYFERLAEGGTVEMPLAKQVWGDHYGQLTDRFGVSWMVNIVDSDVSGS
jgi:PhnB protein